ncbi:acetyltransferase [Arthrobacter sp. AB6]|uniref:acetyltransferase n=1 Tax=Arthrobacter sp. AB6 TaxID=2962570 RepID=UPI00288103A9|nr:acetyltransferase [Arthrobacter sp. AB6]MDT0193796.1 acetyltransferase [Arthrobacter sp. AB6]
MEDLVVIGAGGFGRETLDVVDAINSSADKPTYSVVGVIDPMPGPENLRRLRARGVDYLGSDDDWLATGKLARYVVAIGNPRIRLRIDTKYQAAGHLRVWPLVHPSAGIGSSALPGDGSVICAGVQVSTNVSMGLHVQLNPNSTIGHDSVLDDFVSVNPGAIISGGVHLMEGAFVGAGAVVLEALTVGSYARVGASACVVRDVSSGVTVKGVPAL